MDVGIIDYRCGNTLNLSRAIEALGGKPIVTAERDRLAKCQMICLPGMGAFAPAMESLRSNNLVDFLHDQFGKKFILAICVGMQLLYESSDEDGLHAGLGLLKGKVRKIETTYKLPHIGWRELQLTPEGKELKSFSGVDPCRFYFSHSYAADLRYPVGTGAVTSVTEYTGYAFPASVAGNKFLGTQFHPERSQAQGLALIRRVMEQEAKGQ